MSEKPPFFRILSLDGGGMRGALSAKILEQVEKQIWEKENKSLTEYFDLVAGTSTGSILAAGIALGLKASDLFKLYNDNGNQIFSRRKRHLRKFAPGLSRLGLFARYSNKGIRKKGEHIAHPKLNEPKNRVDQLNLVEKQKLGQ